MKQINNYLLAELSATLCLLLSTVFLLNQIQINYRVYFILAVIVGFVFSCLARQEESDFLKTIVAISIIAVLAWAGYSIFNSSLFYKEIIFIWVKALLILIVILSFNVFSFSGLIQGLSLTVFMCSAVFIEEYNYSLIILAVFYLICWAIIFKMKFYRSLRKPFEANINLDNYPLVLALIIFLLSLLGGTTIYLRFPIKHTLGWNILQAKGGLKQQEKDYYYLQSEILKKIFKEVEKIKTIQNKRAVVSLLSYLIKESPKIQEVDRAEIGLISYLKQPGPGIESGYEEDKEIELQLRQYVDKKINSILDKFKNSLLGTLKNNLDIIDRLSSLQLLNKITQAQDLDKLYQYEQKLRESIENSLLDITVKPEINTLIKSIVEWKAYEIQRQSLSMYERMGKSANITKTQNVEVAEPLKDIRKMQEEESHKLKMELIPQNRLYVLMKNSLFIILLILSLSFIAFYVLRRSSKIKLVRLYQDNPQEFIINIYYNLKEILRILGPDYTKEIPPLSYAQLIESKYGISEGLFSKFTMKFEEAKFSDHILKSDDASLVLEHYNTLLGFLFNTYNKTLIIFRKISLFISRRPSFIHI